MAHNFYESKTMPDLQEMDINVMKEKAKKRFLQENSPLHTNAERAAPIIGATMNTQTSARA